MKPKKSNPEAAKPTKTPTKPNKKAVVGKIPMKKKGGTSKNSKSY